MQPLRPVGEGRESSLVAGSGHPSRMNTAVAAPRGFRGRNFGTDVGSGSASDSSRNEFLRLELLGQLVGRKTGALDADASISRRLVWRPRDDAAEAGSESARHVVFERDPEA